MANKNRNKQTRVHPIQLQRIRKELTQEQLAAVANVTKGLIMRIEQGLISGVTYEVLDALWPNDSLHQAKALDEVDKWREDTRAKNIEYFVTAVDKYTTGGWMGFRTSVHPTAVGFCKLYCIHPQVLANFEKPHIVNRRRGLSPYLREVFSSAGNDVLEELEEKLRYWADSRELTGGG